MARPDPALLDPARYPFSCNIQPRFGDLDVNMHVNNVAMAGMLEDARVRFHRQAGHRARLAGISTMVASIAIEYLGETSYPDDIAIACAVEHVGRTSHRVVQMAMQDERPLVFARTVVVAVGPEGPYPLPDDFVLTAQSWMLRE